MTLQTGMWYACQLIGDEFRNEACSYSPIRVDEVEPSSSGKRVFELRFFHARYPEGVQDKVYRLQTIHRGESLILARSLDHKPCRMLQISELTGEWLKKHCGIQEKILGDIQDYLRSRPW